MIEYKNLNVNTKYFPKELDMPCSSLGTDWKIYVDDTEENRSLISAVIDSHEKSARDLDEARDNKISQLWDATQLFIEQYFYDQDIVEARRAATISSDPKYNVGVSIRSWINSVYTEYYAKKSIIRSATMTELNNIDLSYSIAAPEYGTGDLW